MPRGHLFTANLLLALKSAREGTSSIEIDDDLIEEPSLEIIGLITASLLCFAVFTFVGSALNVFRPLLLATGV